MSARPPDLAEGGKGASRATLRCASALRCAKWDVSCDGGNALSCVALGEAMCLDWVKGDLAQLQAPQSGSAGGRGEREGYDDEWLVPAVDRGHLPPADQ